MSTFFASTTSLEVMAANENEIGKGGVKYRSRQGLCLETQYFPDSLNHKGFSNVILKAGEEYNHTTIYKVSIKNK